MSNLALCTGDHDFDQTELVTSDGTVLRVFEYGPTDAATIIVVNPIGVPILLASRLMRLLGERYRTVCWEQRGCRNDPEYLPQEKNDYGLFLEDLAHVVRAKAAATYALVGICSGASLALKAVAEGLVEPVSLVLVSPAVRLETGHSPSLFDKSVVPYMRMIAAGNRQLAKGLLEIKQANLAQSLTTRSADELLIEAADRWSLRSVESLLIYARTIRSFADRTLDAELPRITQKVHVISAADDQTVSIDSVRNLARRLANADLTEYAQGGHFLLFFDQSVRATVAAIIARDIASLEEAGGIEHDERGGRGDMQRDMQCVGSDAVTFR